MLTAAAPRAILVSMLVNLGDVIMITSVLEMLRRRFPQAKLGALVRPESAEIVLDNPVVDEVVVYPYRSGSAWQGLGAVKGKIAAGGYDLFLSMDRRPRGALAAMLAGVKKRFGPRLLFEGRPPKWWARLLFTTIVPMSPADCRGSLMLMFQQVARRAFELEGPAGRITLPPPPLESREKAGKLLTLADGRPLAGLCLKTNFPGKTWPAANSAALIRRLLADGCFLYITGAPGDRDYVAEVLAAAGADARALNLAGRTALMDLAALAPLTDLFVTPDNGAAHLLANAGLKRLICLLAVTTPDMLAESMPQAEFITFQPGDESPAAVDLVYGFARKNLRKPD